MEWEGEATAEGVEEWEGATWERRAAKASVEEGATRAGWTTEAGVEAQEGGAAGVEEQVGGAEGSCDGSDSSSEPSTVHGPPFSPWNTEKGGAPQIRAV